VSSSGNISVIVPVRNGFKTLPACLDALNTEKQGFTVEVIVIDDASDDDSERHIAEKFGAKFIRLDRPSGPSVARNRGADVAQGEILLFIDADVQVPEGSLGIIRDNFKKHPEIGGIQGTYSTKIPNSNPASFFAHLAQLYYIHTAVSNLDEMLIREVGTFCVAIRREEFFRVSGFDETFTFPNFEDRELGARLNQHQVKVRFVPELRVTHMKKLNAWDLLRNTFLKAFRNTKPTILKRRFRQDLLYNTNHAFQYTFYLRTILISVLVATLVLALAGWQAAWWMLAVFGGVYLVSMLGILWLAYKIRGIPMMLLYFLFSFPEHLVVFSGGVTGAVYYLVFRGK